MSDFSLPPSSAYITLPKSLSNTSPHLALMLIMTGANIKASSPCPTKTTYKNWRKADKTAYFVTLKQYLEDPLDIIDSDAAIKFLSDPHKAATDNEVPIGLSNPGLKPNPFNDTFRELSAESKETDWLRKTAGCPPDPNSLFNHRKAIRRLLCKAQCTENAMQQEKVYEDMKTQTGDTQMFLKTD